MIQNFLVKIYSQFVENESENAVQETADDDTECLKKTVRE